MTRKSRSGRADAGFASVLPHCRPFPRGMRPADNSKCDDCIRTFHRLAVPPRHAAGG